METNLRKAQAIRDAFLEQWPEEKVEEMELDTYVSVNNPFTFCQWVEHRTKSIGSIPKDSFKFGIYRRQQHVDIKEKFPHDDMYSWRVVVSRDVSNRHIVFDAVRKELLEVIRAARSGQFERIDNDGFLLGVFKWKVAFLYSNERLVPIYSSVILRAMAPRYGLKKSAPISRIQMYIMKEKPSYMSVYEYADNLLRQHRGEELSGGTIKRKKRVNRKGMDTKGTEDYTRKGAEPSIVTRWHNKLQLKLKEELGLEYGPDQVLMEDDYVDIKVITTDGLHLYEVKTMGTASDCITAAMGQILRYAYRHTQGVNNVIKLVVAGQYKMEVVDHAFLSYIQERVNIPLEYRQIILP